MSDVVTEPGLYSGISAETYHGDRGSLSSSGARRLTPPKPPEAFAYERDHGRPPKRDFDFGHIAHREVLGEDTPMAVIEFPDYKTRAAQQQRDDARAAGLVPILVDELATIRAMAERLREHPLAGKLLDRDHGQPDVSGYWTDAATGVSCRVRFDWLPDGARGRLLLPEYKTGKSAEPVAFCRTVADYGYHQQADWYIEAALHLGIADEVGLAFVVQEKVPPYLVSVVELDDVALMIGAHQNRQAREIFARCTASGVWPGYTDDEPALGRLPSYLEYRYRQEHDL